MLQLPYWFLKFQAVAGRTLHTFNKWFRRTFQYLTDFEKTFDQVTREYTIPSSTSDRKIRIRVWDPPNAAQIVHPRPVHINFHPSGYLVVDEFGVDGDFCQFLAAKLGITVLDCEYAKGPEYPFPNAYNEAIDLIKHVLSVQSDATLSSPLYDPENITMGGFSAGGGLSLAISATDSDFGRKYIKAVVAVYPWVDVKVAPGAVRKQRKGSRALLLNGLHFYLFRTSAVMKPYRTDDPRISPSYLSDEQLGEWLSGGGKPKICLMTAGADSLETQGKEFAERMKKAGGDVLHHSVPEVGHEFDKYNRAEGWEADRKAEMYNMIVDFLREVYAAPIVGKSVQGTA